MEKEASLTLRKYEEAVKYLFNRTGISIHTKCFLLYHIGIAIYLNEYMSVARWHFLGFVYKNATILSSNFCTYKVID